MEFVERIDDLTKIEYLNQMPFSDFCEHMNPDSKKEDLINSYKTMKTICKQHLKSKGKCTRWYAHSSKSNNTVGGRLFCGNSIQNLCANFRGLICDKFTTDIDMKNAHPNILRYLCDINDIPCSSLKHYNNNRDDILNHFDDRSAAKKLFLSAINNDKLNRKEKNSFFIEFDNEMKRISKQLCKVSEYADIVNLPSSKQYNLTGSALNRILCHFENRILHNAINLLKTNNFEIMTPMFDGMLIYGDHYDNYKLLNDITESVENEFMDLKMEWAYKPHYTDIVIPDDYEPTSVIMDRINSYDKVKELFEQTHIKIINRGLILRKYDNAHIPFTDNKLKFSYGHMGYEYYDEEKYQVKSNKFIPIWLQDTNINRKDDCGVYPNDKLCPKEIYNLWTPFAMEHVMEWEHHSSGLEMIRKHILILCDNDESIALYFEKWIGQMIAYPEVKSNFPIIISDEGAGKGTLMRLFEKMLGQKKVMETTTPSRDVWGEFNSAMENSFLVNLNELSKKETMECDHRIKGLITDPQLTINHKGTNKYDITSYHRFIGTTNNEEAGIKTQHGDRRKWIVRASDELKGNHAYFKEIYTLLDDENLIKTCYEYFKNLPDLDKFNQLPLPITEFNEEIKEVNTCCISRWVRDYISDHYYSEHQVHKKLLARDLYSKFRNWCKSNGKEYNITNVQFGVRLKNLRIDGIDKGPLVKGCKSFNFDLQKMKSHYKMTESDDDGDVIDYDSFI